MKLEEQKLVRVDGGNVLQVWTDIETRKERYEVAGQTNVPVQTPQGMMQVPVDFRFEIEAENLAQAAEQLPERIKDEAGKAARKFIGTLQASERRIQIPNGDQVIQFRKDAPIRNGSPLG